MNAKYRRFPTTFLAAAIVTLLVQGSAAAQPPSAPRSSSVPGGIAVIALDQLASSMRPAAYFGEKRVMVIGQSGQWQAVVGIPLDAEPGEHMLDIESPGAAKQKVSFSVQSKEYETQHLTIKNKRMVEPNAKDFVRITKESKIISLALRKFSETDDVPLEFSVPVHGTLSSPFGLRRFFNEQPRKPHSGLDLAAPKGTPINAPAPGDVIAVGNYFFNGNTVILDHGQGLISMYSHMNRIDVKIGQHVNQGTLLGAVGMTGRVTGPHLHWTVSMNDTRVDPMLLFSEQTVAQLTSGDKSATATGEPTNPD